MKPPTTDTLLEAPTPLAADELRLMDAYWRACNYLSLGMLYLCENPLLRESLRVEHIKKRLIGHWGSTPGQNFIWVHLNRVITRYDMNMIYISGPGHGAPAVLANAYLEGTYSEVYPDKSQDVEGLRRFFKQFSFPGGIGSHATPETPGSIHEGGELGYSVSHAFGAAFDNPDLLVAAVIGDGEAETGPLMASLHSNKFLNPIRDGAVLPILHLNGYKIANPTISARISSDELHGMFAGFGWTPHLVEGDDPPVMHRKMATTVETCINQIRTVQEEARHRGKAVRPRWPMIILRTPKGWTAPKELDGHKLEGYWRAHQIPILDVAENPAHLAMLEAWMRSYRPEDLFDETGSLVPQLRALAPTGHRRMSANPHANGGLLRIPLRIPDFRAYGVSVIKPGAIEAQSTFLLGSISAGCHA
ncbi:MAG TPA: phosphoketolase family protein [Nitrospira sp.]|nr:phosphoketolase family protein [Nitrospira sp.]